MIRLLHWLSHRWRKLPPLPSTPPRPFSIGFYAVNTSSPFTNAIISEFPALRDAGISIIHSYQFEGDPDGPANSNADALEYLDAAYATGLKVLLGIPQICVTEGRYGFLDDRVSQFASHPALYGWQLYDEPDDGWLPGKVTPSQLASAYDRLRQSDASHPIGIASYYEIYPDYPWMNGFDLLESDYLSIPLEGTQIGIDRARIASLTLHPPKQVFGNVQVSNLANDPLIWAPTGHPTSDGRYPTRAEMFQILQGLYNTQGCSGAFLNCYRFDYAGNPPGGDDVSPSNNPSQWSAILSALSDFFAWKRSHSHS